MISLNYDDSEVTAYLSEAIKRSQNLTPALNEIGQTMLASTDQRFETETDPYGVRWKPNTPAVQRYKQSRGFIMKVLQRRGVLRNSINYKVTNNSVSVGTNVSYGVYHQLGNNRREFLGVSATDKEDIISILAEYLTESE